MDEVRPDSAAIAAIFARAAQRAREQDLPYAGAVTPREAWTLQAPGAATIVEVRTRVEWTYVGRIAGAPLVEWRRLDEQHPSPGFLDELARHVGQRRGTLGGWRRAGLPWIQS